MDNTPSDKGRPETLRAALFGLCPDCGARSLFDGVIQFAPSCRQCGLDYSSFNVGDGPAAFLTLLVGGIITALALTLEVLVTPPFWLHILLWVPLTAVMVTLALRSTKAAMLILEHRGQVREARLVADAPDSSEDGEP